MCGALPWSWSWSRPWVAGWSVGEAARKRPGSGFSTVIRWVSSVPSRFQGGYCHESGVECMFPAARQSNSERPRAQVRRIVLFVQGALWLSGCGARWTGGETHASVASVTRHSSRTRFPHTPRKILCLSNGTQWTEASTQLGASEIGQYRDRTVHMGRCRQGVSVVSILSLCPALLLDSLISGFLFQGTHGTRQEWTEAAERGESSGQR